MKTGKTETFFSGTDEQHQQTTSDNVVRSISKKEMIHYARKLYLFLRKCSVFNMGKNNLLQTT
jgi:hypothetical protein